MMDLHTHDGGAVNDRIGRRFGGGGLTRTGARAEGAEMPAERDATAKADIVLDRQSCGGAATF